jgi:hypothetical protein
MRRIIVLALTLAICGVGAPASAAVISLEGVVPNAASAHVTPGGLDFVGDVATDLLEGINLDSLIYGLNPLFNVDSCALIFKGVGAITQYSFDQRQVEIFTQPVMDLAPVSNGLYVRFSLGPAAGQNLITIGISGYWGLGCTQAFLATLAMNATPLQIAASITADYTPGVGFAVVVHEVVLNTDNITFEFAGLPDPSLGPLIEELVVAVLPSLVSGIAPELINEAIAEQLAGIVLEGSSDVGGYTVVYAFDPTITTNSQGVNLVTSGQLYLQGTTFDPCADPGAEIGSPYTNGPLPSFGSTTPGGDPYDIALAIADDLLNQTLYSFLAKGELCMMFPFDLKQSGKEDAANLIDLYPIDLPHFVVGQGGTDLALISNPFRLDWYIQKEGRYVELLGADIDIDLALSLAVDQNNQLLITLEDSSIEFAVDDTEFNILPPAVIELVLNTLINDVLLPMIADALPPIPLPQLLGYQFSVKEVGGVGANQDYFGLYCDFVPTSLALQRPAAAFDLPGLGVVADVSLGVKDSARAGLFGESPRLRLTDLGDAPADYYRVRLDGRGFWRNVPDAEIDLTGLRAGRHSVEAVAVSAEGVSAAQPARLSFLLGRGGSAVSPH